MMINIVDFILFYSSIVLNTNGDFNRQNQIGKEQGKR